MTPVFANLNELWSRTIASTLKANGVRYAIVCPGSRSAPLAFAFARTEGIEAIPVLDERSAGFFALGLAKREGLPVALICTSGTAAANFFPAVVEAAESGVPLLVLTADRPPELRACRAGQTIDQVKLYGSYPVSQVELALPESSVSLLRYLRNTVATQAERSLSPRQGPVHLNIPFRDPLPPLVDEAFEGPMKEGEWERLFDKLGSVEAGALGSDLNLDAFVGDCERGAIIVGSPLSGAGPDWVRHVATLAKRLPWPVLADGLNPLRGRSDSFPYLITRYDSIFRSGLTDEELTFEKAIVIGDLPISKSLRQWLADREIECLFLNSQFADFDPTRTKSRSLYFDFNLGTPQVSGKTDASFAEQWARAEQSLEAALASRLDQMDFFFEGKVASVLSRCLPRGSSLFVSNSMPPRDLECFGEANDRGVLVYSSRGASGIDGILSTALGIAHGGRPTCLLTGDLALLHDSNGALIAKVLEGGLTIVLVNNSGGGIFEMLPVANLEDAFETYFGTDQKVDFSQWAATYGIEYNRPADWAELQGLLETSFESGTRLIEIVTDRKRDAALRKELYSELAATAAEFT